MTSISATQAQLNRNRDDAMAELKAKIFDSMYSDNPKDLLKKLLTPTETECPYCKKILHGTDYDNERHVQGCEVEKIRKELQDEKDKNSTSESLLKELEKLV
jgi:hypothetical protein